MTHERICDWLGLPGEAWPPDHYRLLGLPPGEGDAARIEQQVHERVEKVRRYQLLHPEHVTEAMNRLAQAFVCLTNPEAKKAYDTKLFHPRAAPSIEEAVKKAPAAEAPDPLAWLTKRQEATRAATQLEMPAFEDRPPVESPVFGEETSSPESPGPETEITERPDLVPPPVRRMVGTISEKKDIILEAAHTALPARRGLGTKRAFYHRIARTRQLLRAWSEAGDYLGHPTRKLAKPVEATQLIHALITLRTELKSFPPLLGQAGQPGYLVIALARQQVIVPTFQTLLPSQREALARDWRAGLKLLHAHVQFLREELRAMRRRGFFGRTMRLVNSLFHSHLGVILLLLGFLAVAVAAWRSFRPATEEAPPQPGSEPPRQVARGPVSRSFSEVNAPKRSSRSGLESTESKPDPTEKPPPEEKTTPATIVEADPPKPGKEEPTESVRFQADDKINCIRSVAFLSNDRFVYCNGHEKLFVCNVGSNADEAVAKFQDPLLCLTVCPSSAEIACGDDAGQVYLVHEKDGVHWEVRPLEKKHDKQVNALTFSADGKWLLSGGKDGKVLVWDVRKGALSCTLSELSKPVRAVVFSADGRRAMAGSEDGNLYFWELKGTEWKEVARHPAGAVLCLALTKDDRFLFSGGQDGVIRRWDVFEPSKESKKYGALERPVEAVVLSPDNHYLYSGDLQGNIKRWNVDRENQPRSLEGPNDLVLSLAISPNGKSILSGQAAGRLVLSPLESPPSAGPK